MTFLRQLFFDVRTSVLMREHGIRTIYATDTGFLQFPDIEVVNPLKQGEGAGIRQDAVRRTSLQRQLPNEVASTLEVVMQAMYAYIAGMQYTLRNIPPALDQALRARANRDGTSLNEAAVMALARALGLGETPVRCRSLTHLAGTWQDDPEFDEAIQDQRSIDQDLWR